MMKSVSTWRMFNFHTKHMQGDAVNTNTTFSKMNHPKNILSEIKSAKGLPFSEILSSEIIIKHIENLEYRTRFFPPDITLWMFLSQVFNDDQSLQAALERAIVFFLSQEMEVPSSNSTAAYSKARTRLPEELLSNLVIDSGKELEKQTPIAWLWDERHAKLVDGSTVSMPDTLENQEAYPQPDSQKKGVGFPIARVVAVTSCTTGAVLNLAIGPYSGKKTGEHALLRQLMDTFDAGDVVLGDCYYASYFLIAALMKKGVDAVFPIHAARNHDFRTGQRFGKKDHVVQWIKPTKPEWMEQEEYDSFQNEITIRELAIQSEHKGYQTKSRVMVTTFLDPKTTPKAKLAILYSYRWRIELDFKSIKETMRMDILRGKTPAMVRKEIWAHLLGYNLIRKIMAQSAYVHNKIPRQLSFKLALQAIEAFRNGNLLSGKNVEIYAHLLKMIAYKTVGNRPNRYEPRRVKRRAKSFPKMQKARHLYKRKLSAKGLS